MIRNKIRYNTNHGLIRQLQTVKTVADCPDSQSVSQSNTPVPVLT